MQLPDELVLRRFRSFADEVTLPLRPITLVYGANNSGKSALLRALALLGNSLNPELTSAVDLPDAAFKGVRFQDLAWKGEAGDYSWHLGLRWKKLPIREVSFKLNGGSDTDPTIDQLTVRSADGSAQRSFRVNEEHRLIDPDSGAEIPTNGLVPTSPILKDLIGQLSWLRGRIRWLSGVRAGPGRVIERAQSELELYGDGASAAPVLVRNQELREAVARFYMRLDPPRRLEHREQVVGTFFTLNPALQPTWLVNINDTGEGMTQVLPVLAQASMTAMRGGLLAVEEPESHLHPNAQRELAAHFCELANAPTEPRFILETHSRVFLLAIQLMVKNGFPPEKVSVVWVDQDHSGRSQLTSIPLRASGRMGDGWPRSALDEDFALAAELMRTRSRDSEPA